jgi:hypothetical protein
MWAHGKDTKRIFTAKNSQQKTQKDLASVIERQDALREKLSHEQNVYKQELNQLGLALEHTD